LLLLNDVLLCNITIVNVVVHIAVIIIVYVYLYKYGHFSLLLKYVCLSKWGANDQILTN